MLTTFRCFQPLSITPVVPVDRTACASPPLLPWQDISQLEEYIGQSAVIVLMLSRGYFPSRNCMREVKAAVEFKKRLVLLHEGDVKRGGAPLSVLKKMCPEELVDDVFAPEHVLVQWHRVSVFSLRR